MARNHAARAAFGPWCWRPWSHNEPPGRRLVDDDPRGLVLAEPLRGWPVRHPVGGVASFTRGASGGRPRVMGQSTMQINASSEGTNSTRRSATSTRCHPRSRIGHPCLPVDDSADARYSVDLPVNIALSQDRPDGCSMTPLSVSLKLREFARA